jgi:hypothetical protein
MTRGAAQPANVRATSATAKPAFRPPLGPSSQDAAESGAGILLDEDEEHRHPGERRPGAQGELSADVEVEAGERGEGAPAGHGPGSVSRGARRDPATRAYSPRGSTKPEGRTRAWLGGRIPHDWNRWCGGASRPGSLAVRTSRTLEGNPAGRGQG